MSPFGLALAGLLACNGSKHPPEDPSPDVAASAAAAEADPAADPSAAGAAAEPVAASATTDGGGAETEDPYQGMGSSEALAVYRALSVRDPDPDCADIDALSPNPAQTLVDVVERASMPPWVPMRAANCLVQRHAGEVEDTLVGWVSDPESRGLALVVFDSIDLLPEDVALRVARAGLSGPWSEDAATRLARSHRPSITALLPGDAP